MCLFVGICGISVYPKQVVTYVGKDFGLTCENALSVSWAKDGKSIANDDRTTQIENRLLLTRLKESDSGTYTCYGGSEEVGGLMISSASSEVLVGGKFFYIFI